MKSLEELGFPHEASQGAGPALTDHMDPLKIDPRELDSRDGHRFPSLLVSQGLFDDELHELSSIGFYQPGGDPKVFLLVLSIFLVGKVGDWAFEVGAEMGFVGFWEWMRWEPGFEEEGGRHGRH